MNVRELTDEQAEQLGKTLEAWGAYADNIESPGDVDLHKQATAFCNTRKLQEMLQPPKD